METAAVIPIAGKGRRMGTQTSKQFLKLKNKPVIVHTVEAFLGVKEINQIILVADEKEMQFCREEIINKYGFGDVILVPGGEKRQDSVYNGLRFCKPQTDFVIIHDGVRPLISKKLIIDVLNNACVYGACCAAVPVKDTIKIIDKGHYIVSTPDRDILWAAQTPQAFKYDLIMEAHERARASGFIGTDDASLVEKMGEKVKIIEGSYENIKITTPDDLKFAELILTYNSPI
ncbi:MAG TPA: 2-C-methyl-D-erythritol 4-phosphate cytidylyltransferase [Thermoanaerobacterales bacterium]|nr:2-C-methyl-D-erythritol 4-phosphate cytidylyltransferase [Thermoanaerobacterales bacterium]